MSRHTFMILSLVYNAYDNEWVKVAKATFAESKEIKKLFDEMKRSMPVGSTPAEVMKAVNKLIFKNAKASLSKDERIRRSCHARGRVRKKYISSSIASQTQFLIIWYSSFHDLQGHCWDLLLHKRRIKSNATGPMTIGTLWISLILTKTLQLN
jgi:hypothetical protein